jgi:DNA-binding transcriptional LysR family regulator
METKWLEDFVSLAETRSFSRSAQLRHITQPAFSRRIQSLEAWAGTDLVDRSSYPTRLTPAGQTLYDPVSGGVAGAAEHPRHAARPCLGRAGRDRVRRAAHTGVHLFPGLDVKPSRNRSARSRAA